MHRNGGQDASDREAGCIELGGRMHRSGRQDAPKREAHRPVMQGQPQRDEGNNRDNSEGKNNI